MEVSYPTLPKGPRPATPPDRVLVSYQRPSPLRPSVLGLLSAVDQQEKAMESLVDAEKGIGMSLMRICIGTPDFTALALVQL